MKTSMNGSGPTDVIQEFLSRMSALLDALNEEGVEATTALRERIAASIDALQPRLDQWRESAADTARYVQELVEENPWAAVAVGAAAGVAVGCVAVVVASNFLPETDLAGKAADYRGRVVGRARPIVQRARKLASDYLPA